MRDYRYATQEFKETGEDHGKAPWSTKVINHFNNRTNGTNNHSAIPSNGSRSGANN